MTTAQINVLKRNGRGKEPLNIDILVGKKVHLHGKKQTKLKL